MYVYQLIGKLLQFKGTNLNSDGSIEGLRLSCSKFERLWDLGAYIIKFWNICEPFVSTKGLALPANHHTCIFCVI